MQVTIEDALFAKNIPILTVQKLFMMILKKFVNEELNYQFHELNRRIIENDYGRLCVASDVVVEIEIDD